MPKRYLAVATLTVIIIVSIAAMNSNKNTDLQRSISSTGDASPADKSTLLSTMAGKDANIPAQTGNIASQESTINAITRLSDKFVGGNSACNPRVVVCE